MPVSVPSLYEKCSDKRSQIFERGHNREFTVYMGAYYNISAVARNGTSRDMKNITARITLMGNRTVYFSSRRRMPPTPPPS